MTIMDIRSKPKSKWRPVALDTVVSLKITTFNTFSVIAFSKKQKVTSLMEVLIL